MCVRETVDGVSEGTGPRVGQGTERNELERRAVIYRGKWRSAGLKFAVITKDEGRKRIFLRITYKG